MNISIQSATGIDMLSFVFLFSVVACQKNRIIIVVATNQPNHHNGVKSYVTSRSNRRSIAPLLLLGNT